MNPNEQTPPRRRAVRSAQVQGSRPSAGAASGRGATAQARVPSRSANPQASHAQAPQTQMNQASASHTPVHHAPGHHTQAQNAQVQNAQAQKAQTTNARPPKAQARPAAGRVQNASEQNPSQSLGPRKSPPRPASKTAARRKTPRNPKPTSGKVESTALSSLLKGVIYIIVILMVSGTLAYYGITAGNDIFAFKKSDALIEISLGQDATVEDLAKMLYDKGVIIYEDVFVFYAKLRSKDTGFIATTETVSPSMGYDALLAAFKEKPKQPETIRVTIPEGYTVDEIIDLFVLEYGVGTREGFIKAIDEYDYDYWFVKELNESELRDGRKYRLEGYLYPDTYYFYTTSSEVTIINKFLANFESKFANEFKERAAELGWTIDDVIILASMIQMEAKFESDYGKVSSVFHNRLVSNKTQGKLESDATIQYVLQERTEDLTNEMLQLDSPYNTRLYAGLPPGPITNVTLYAINYALFPDETNYFFFVSRPGGYTLFAETYAQHLVNIEAVEYEKIHGTLPS